MTIARLAVRCACLLALTMLVACAADSGESAPAASTAGAGGSAGTGSGLGSEHDPVDEGGSGIGGGFDSPSAGVGGASGMGASAGTGGAGGGAGTGASTDSESGEPGLSGDGDGDDNGQIQAGTLTAGVWDDNRNYERFGEYRSDLLQGGAIGTVMPTTDGDHAEAHELFAKLGPARALLDVSLVIDTTGSMADELSYLQAELSSISQRIEAAYPDAEQRWSLIVYRDEGDAYVTQAFDFTNDLTMMRSKLNGQSADGGGDFPEAPDAALRDANALAWRTGEDVARLVFWVADAPHHDEKAADLKTAVLEAQAIGVHIYPVASSGIDELTELTMRSAAQLTGGRYLFLTSDSGVGGEHKEPTIPCYFVTKLDDAIIRMVDIEMSGEYRAPDEDEILRTGGDPEDGACQLEGDDEAMVF